MITSEKCREAIKAFEGLRLEPYKCPAGKLTIGYGHMYNGRTDVRITKVGAELLFARDLKVIETFLNYVTNVNTQGRFDAMVSFIFNVGIPKFKASTLYRMIRRDASDKVIIFQLQRWVYVNRVPMRGLTMRRQWECERWCQK